MDILDKKIAIIGMGHMGKALYKGLLHAGFNKRNIFLSNKSEDNNQAIKKADWIILAVKPSIALRVIEEVKDTVQDKVLISVAAGINISNIESYTGNQKKVIRIMPNIVVEFGQGVIGMYVNRNILKVEKKEIIAVLSLLGIVVEVKKESEIDVLTLISGCGPGLVAYLINIFEQSGSEYGLSDKISQDVVLQTFKGTLSCLENTKQTAGELQRSVSTKGGVTEEIIKNFDRQKINLRFRKSLDKGHTRIKKIGREGK